MWCNVASNDISSNAAISTQRRSCSHLDLYTHLCFPISPHKCVCVCVCWMILSWGHESYRSISFSFHNFTPRSFCVSECFFLFLCPRGGRGDKKKKSWHDNPAIRLTAANIAVGKGVTQKVKGQFVWRVPVRLTGRWREVEGGCVVKVWAGTNMSAGQRGKKEKLAVTQCIFLRLSLSWIRSDCSQSAYRVTHTHTHTHTQPFLHAALVTPHTGSGHTHTHTHTLRRRLFLNHAVASAAPPPALYQDSELVGRKNWRACFCFSLPPRFWRQGSF